jgi:UDP-N-acetylglucosamine 2-epimerase (non-hydrolysing)
VPEETNRRMVDHISDFNLVYTEHARRNLLAEGIHPRRILHTGSPMREVLEHYLPQISASDVVSRLGLEPGGYFLVSAHREENVDDPARLSMLLDCLRAVRSEFGLPLLVSTHPRTRKRLEAFDAGPLEGIEFHEPFGFFDYVRLQTQAKCVLSDSGTISEESAILGFPAVTLRESIERPESLEAGTILMTGLASACVPEVVKATLVRDVGASGCCADYMVRDTSRRVGNALLSTVHQHANWAGLPAGSRRQPSLDADRR